MHDSMPADWLCCAYLRKSREDEERERYGKGDTLARHAQIVERAAAENGHRIAEWYREVVSGETISGRPEMRRLLGDLIAGKWDAVYVVEASRLGRGGGADQEKIVNAFRYTDTTLITEYDVYDPESASHMRQLKRELRSSEDELESISARMVLGKYEAAREGRWQTTGRTPYGWQAVRIRGVWQLRPDGDHASLLRMYDMLESGLGPAAIASAYNREGVPTARGGHHWTPAAVERILRNPVNCGYVRYAANVTRRKFDPETFEAVKVRVRNDDPILAKGLHSGTGGIDEDRFDRLMGAMAQRSRTRKDRELRNPLAGILRCGKCGYTMVCHPSGGSGSRYYTYGHQRAQAMTRPCDGCRGARASLVMDVLVESLKQVAGDIEIDLGGEGERKRHEERTKALRDALGKAEAARVRAIEAYEAGAYSVAELKERKGEADRRIREIESAIASARPPERDERTVASLHECIGLLADDGVSAQAKNDFAKAIIDHIDYYNDTPSRVRPNKIRLEIFLR